MLTVIVFLAFVLRAYFITFIPNSLSADEVATGYNSYSVLKTGRDEFNQKLPLSFRSFDDYKNPLMVYADIPFVHFFGLTELSVRLLPILLGTLSVIFSYKLTIILTKKRKLALIVSLFSAVSPWEIQYSRVGVDVQIGFSLALLAIWVFLKGKKDSLFYLLGGVIMGLDFYAYHSSKLFLLLFFPVLILFLGKINRWILVSLAVFMVMIAPYFISMKIGNAALRPYTVSVFSDLEKIYSESRLIISDRQEGIFGGQFFHNRRFTFINQAINGYLHILSPEILFSQNSDNQISSTRLFYLWQLPLIALGITLIIKNKRLSFFILSWILIGLIPGGLTNLNGYDRRIFLIAFPLIFLTSVGFKFIAKNKVYSVFLVGIFLFSFNFYLHNYFVHGQKEVVKIWGAGMKEMVLSVEDIKDKYDKVYVSVYLNQPLTYFLFYENYDPMKYLATGGTKNGAHFNEDNKLESYTFKVIGINDLKDGNLYVWESNESQPCLQPFRKIRSSDGKIVALMGIFDPQKVSCHNIIN